MERTVQTDYYISHYIAAIVCGRYEEVRRTQTVEDGGGCGGCRGADSEGRWPSTGDVTCLHRPPPPSTKPSTHRRRRSRVLKRGAREAAKTSPSHALSAQVWTSTRSWAPYVVLETLPRSRRPSNAGSLQKGPSPIQHDITHRSGLAITLLLHNPHSCALHLSTTAGSTP